MDRWSRLGPDAEFGHGIFTDVDEERNQPLE